jgi:hypothetical protein
LDAKTVFVAYRADRQPLRLGTGVREVARYVPNRLSAKFEACKDVIE